MCNLQDDAALNGALEPGHLDFDDVLAGLQGGESVDPHLVRLGHTAGVCRNVYGGDGRCLNDAAIRIGDCAGQRAPNGLSVCGAGDD